MNGHKPRTTYISKCLRLKDLRTMSKPFFLCSNSRSFQTHKYAPPALNNKRNQHFKQKQNMKCFFWTQPNAGFGIWVLLLSSHSPVCPSKRLELSLQRQFNQRLHLSSNNKKIIPLRDRRQQKLKLSCLITARLSLLRDHPHSMKCNGKQPLLFSFQHGHIESNSLFRTIRKQRWVLKDAPCTACH